MRPRGLLFVAGGLTGILALAAALLLLEPPDETLPQDALRARVGEDDRARRLPGVAPDEATAPGLLALAVEPPTAEDGASADPSQAAPVWPGVPHLLTGRVLDPAGQPLAGARVLLVPDAFTLRAAGLRIEGGSRLVDLRRDALPSTLSGADGRFELDARLVGWRPSEERDHEQPAAPLLLVAAPGCVLLGRTCDQFPARRLDAGDLQLADAASIEGHVVDEAGRPLAGVQVKTDLEGDWEDDTRAPALAEAWWHVAVSDEQGHYLLEDLPAASLQLTARSAGRVPAWVQVDAEAGQRVEADDLLLEAGHVVAGTVSDPQGRPVAGAVVASVSLNLAQRGKPQGLESLRRQLRDAPETGRALADGEGRFELRGLQRNNLSVAAAAAGFEPAVLHDVHPGRRDLSLTLQPPAELLVSVVSAAGGQPVTDAVVEARRSWNRGGKPGRLEPLLASEPVADRPGTLLVRGAGPGATQVSVRATGHASVIEWADGLPAGERGTLLVTLPTGVPLEAVVLDDAGAPLAGAGVMLQSRDEDGDLVAAGKHGRSDETGRFRFEGLLPGVYAVTATAEGCATRTSEDLPIDTRAPDRPVELRLARAATLRVSVLRADGRPAPWQDVKLEPVDAAVEEREASADRRGRLVQIDLAPGTWLVSAAGTRPVQVALVSGEEQAIELRLPERARIYGFVTSGGQPVAGTQVGAWGEHEEGAEAETDATGRYELELAAGDWFVWTRPTAGSMSKVTATVLPGEQRRVDIELPTGRLTVRAQDAQAGPIAGAHVQLWRHDPESLEPDGDPEDAWQGVAGDNTGEEGGIDFAQLAPGDYRVSSWGPDGWLAADAVETRVSEEPAKVVLTLQPAARIRGQVLSSNGLPFLDGAIVQVFDAQGDHDQRGMSWARGDEGRFEFNGLAAGRYVVCVRRQWSQQLGDQPSLVEQSVTLATGQTESVALILPRLP